MDFQPAKVYLGLGSNLGSREDNLKQALDLISHRIRLVKVSSIYDTAPIGDDNQPRFLNLVCEVTTTLPPAGLLAQLKGFELKLGRLPARVNGSRSIDIDILFYGDMVLDTPEVTIPHPRVAERCFVLEPLAEIAPDLVHPLTKKTVKQMRDKIAGSQDVRRVASAEGA